jgi:hypothetical protein
MTTQTAPTGTDTDTAQEPTPSKPLTEAEMRAYMATIDPQQVRATLQAEQRDAECVKMFATLLAFGIEYGFFGADQSEQVEYIKIDSEGNISTNRLRLKRSKRKVKAKTDDGEDEEYGVILANALVQFYEDKGLSQTDLRDLLRTRGRNGKPPSQPTISNWLNGESTPSSRWHDRLTNLLLAEGYLEEAEDDGDENDGDE